MLRETSILHLPARIGNCYERNALLAKAEYTDTPMAATTINRTGVTETARQMDAAESIDYAAIGKIRQQVNEHVRVTFHETGAASATQTQELLNWANSLESNPDSINGWEHFISWSRSAMRSAVMLYNVDLKAPLEAALSKKIISRKSYEKWIQRFRSSQVDYKTKEYWVENQFPHYIAAWEKAANERKELLKNPQLKLLAENRDVRMLQDENMFLDMHYDRRMDLMAKVRAALAVNGKDKGAEVFKKLHVKAQGILRGAVQEGILSGNKIGSWMERIFKSSATPDMIDRFLSHGNSTSIYALMTKWRAVRRRYDDVHQKGAPLKNPAVGMYIIPAERFLMMHYTQRLRWVEEAEQRIADATNIDKERPVFIRIRHALDVKDWEDAEQHIKQAAMEDLSDSDRSRLDSMRRYLTQMRSDKKSDAKNGKEQQAKPNGAQLCNQISEVISTAVPSFMQDMVVRLLRSNHPNRGVHQLRWITYNNKWCRDHNFLDYDRAKKGASKESAEATTQRVKDGRDSGRRQDHVLNAANSSQQHMRNNEYAKRRATLTHVDTADGGFGVNALGEWLEKEQNPKDLYWRTLCIHDNGVPMSESYHNSLFSALTLLRSLTASLEKTPFRYGGLHMPPVSLN